MISLTETWDWKKQPNESQYLDVQALPKNESNPATGNLPVSYMRGYMFHGPANTTNIYRYGGTRYMGNQSFLGYTSPESSTYPVWSYSYNSTDYPWAQYNIGQPWMPNHGAGAEAIDQGLGFYLNGQIDKGTSSKTLNMGFDDGQSLYIPLEGMLIINLVDFSSANLSTSSMNGNAPRVGGTMEYIAPVGEAGVLVALGGQIQPNLRIDEKANRTQGELVSTLPLHS